MSLRILFYCLIISSLSAHAQTMDVNEFLPANDSLRGKLLFITEAHDVQGNLISQKEMIGSISGMMNTADTLNVFIEAPYSLAWAMTRYVRGESTTLVDSVLRTDPDKIEYYFALRKMKRNIRFIGVDFEYDHGNPGARLEAYKAFFDDLKKEFEKKQIDLSVVKSFLYGIRVQGLEEADIYTFRKYIQKLRLTQEDPVLRTKLKDANFILTARTEWDKDDMRDKIFYGRYLEVIKGGVEVSNNFNIAIFGSLHGNPMNEKSLYNKLQYSDDSPFKSVVVIAAGVYINCLSKSGYYDRHFSIENNSLYVNTKEDKQLLELFKTKFPIRENNVSIFRNNLTLPLKDLDRVKYWIVQKEIR